MRFLVVGLGSMGKRRVGNILHLKAGDVVGFDTDTPAAISNFIRDEGNG
jgi:6-phosphogluconate dehydrogenase (decarboxylating)